MQVIYDDYHDNYDYNYHDDDDDDDVNGHANYDDDKVVTCRQTAMVST